MLRTVGDDVVAIGTDIIPELEKHWLSGHEWSRHALSHALHQLGWSPNKEYQKIAFYAAAHEWDKLVEIGEPAAYVLSEESRWDDLVKIGLPAVPVLVSNRRWDDVVKIIAVLISRRPVYTEQLVPIFVYEKDH